MRAIRWGKRVLRRLILTRPEAGRHAEQVPAAIDAATIRLDDPGIAVDPFRAYAVLRRQAPILFLPRHDSWIALSYQAAQTILGDSDRFSSAPYAFIDPVMLAADSPGHGRYRRTVARLFNGETLRALEQVADVTACSAIAERFDAVAAFSHVIARRTAATLIGVDAEGLERLGVAQDAMAAGHASALDQLLAVLDDVVPQTAAFRRLTEADGLTHAEGRSLVRLLWIASTVTTEKSIAQAVLQLLRDPAMEQRLRATPADIPSFIDEVIRLAPPELLLHRSATREVVVEGISIPAGATIFVGLAAANRDADVFPDPDEVKLGRIPANLSFGAGIHACVGGPLGRRVMAAAIRALLRKTVSIASAIPLEAVPFHAGMSFLTPGALWVDARLSPSVDGEILVKGRRSAG